VLREKTKRVDEFMRLVGLEALVSLSTSSFRGMASALLWAALIKSRKFFFSTNRLGALDALRHAMQDEVPAIWEIPYTMLLVTHESTKPFT